MPEQKEKKPQCIADYFKSKQYERDVAVIQRTSNYRTGYANIDTIQNLHPGLYVLGAVPALGKTTFLNQMADQIASDETDVVFFTLEQSCLELTTKSLARLKYMQVLQNEKERTCMDDAACTALQIRNDDRANIDDIIEHYKETVGQHKYIVELGYKSTVDDIKAKTETLLKTNGNSKPLVVIVDYLQAIAPMNDHMQAREAVNYTIEALKTLQRENGIILWAISSFNRASYYAPVTMEAYKESGGIEFTADYVAGLQLSKINRNTYRKEDELRNTAQEEKKKLPRDIDYVCLKNRFGNDYVVSFLYDAEYDCFIPNLLNSKGQQAATTEKRDIDKLIKALDAWKGDILTEHGAES